VGYETVAVLALGLAAFALAVVVLLARHVGGLRRAYDGLVAGESGASFSAALGRTNELSRAVHTEMQGMRAEVTALRADLTGTLRHVAVVRYDAFGDMGGRLSFSAALLDDAGDGLVLTSINSRTETRTYAKGVQGGTSPSELSPEEREAITEATGPRRPARQASDRGL
jgi:HAMP domain-containing protein